MCIESFDEVKEEILCCDDERDLLKIKEWMGTRNFKSLKRYSNKDVLKKMEELDGKDEATANERKA